MRDANLTSKHSTAYHSKAILKDVKEVFDAICFFSNHFGRKLNGISR
jgi:hypothetical protein